MDFLTCQHNPQQQRRYPSRMLYISLRRGLRLGVLCVSHCGSAAKWPPLLYRHASQAVVSVTRFLAKPASSLVTESIKYPMQKLTLIVMTDVNGRKRYMYSDFNPLNTAILGGFGVMEGVGTARSSSNVQVKGELTGSAQRNRSTVKLCCFRILQRRLLSNSGYKKCEILLFK